MSPVPYFQVMGIDKDFASAYAKAQIAAGQKLPTKGKVFLTMVRASLREAC